MLTSFWHHLHRAYDLHIEQPGKQPLFLLLVGFIGSFLFIRFSVRMIRRGVRWWPGNVTPGGLHIHHMVFGMFFLLLGGIGAFTAGASHPWLDVFGLLFGMGCGLVLDEFALILHLEDVYWSEQGRKSVDAVIIGILFTGLLLVGYVPLGVTGDGNSRWVAVGLISVDFVFTVVALLKGKFWSGMVGIMVPGVAWPAALRLARPTSPWARWRYADRPRRLARAWRREARWHRRGDTARQWLFDLIAGKPTPTPTRAQALASRVALRMADRAERTRRRRLGPHAQADPPAPAGTHARRAAAARRRLTATAMRHR